MGENFGRRHQCSAMTLNGVSCCTEEWHAAIKHPKDSCYLFIIPLLFLCAVVYVVGVCLLCVVRVVHTCQASGGCYMSSSIALYLTAPYRKHPSSLF